MYQQRIYQSPQIKLEASWSRLFTFSIFIRKWIVTRGNIYPLLNIQSQKGLGNRAQNSSQKKIFFANYPRLIFKIYQSRIVRTNSWELISLDFIYPRLIWRKNQSRISIADFQKYSIICYWFFSQISRRKLLSTTDKISSGYYTGGCPPF